MRQNGQLEPFTGPLWALLRPWVDFTQPKIDKIGPKNNFLS